MSTQPLIRAVEKDKVRQPLFFLSFSAALALPIPAAHAGMVVKLSHPEADFAGLSTSYKEGTPAGWKYLPAVDLYIVEDEGREGLNRLQGEGAVGAAEEGFEIRLEALPPLPNDPMLDSQGWVGDQAIDVGAAEAWDLLGGGAPITVAVIDTGIDTGHPDLASNLWINEGEVPGNGRDDDGNGYVDDVNGYNFWDETGDVTGENNHGSHMAGIIGAVGDNGVGIAGVDWNARLMTLRFTDDRGNGTSTKAIEAIDYAIRNGAKIINASWTLKLDDDPEKQDRAEASLLRHAIQKAASKGILFVTAAGNRFETDEGVDIDLFPVYPAAFRTGNMIAVAAADTGGGLASYSNFGIFSVDLAAPGDSILSTAVNGGYRFMSGTSMAAAFVSGAAALVYSANPDLTAAQVKAVLTETVAPSPSLEGKVASGGLVHLYEAVSLVQSGSLPEGNTSSVSPSSSVSPPSSSVLFPGCSLIR